MTEEQKTTRTSAGESAAALPRLGRATAPAAALIGASAPTDPSAAGIVHLGLGAFHRAHAAVYTARAMELAGGDWGISAFANRSRRVVDPMREQDGMYALLQLSADGERAGVLDVHRRFGVMAHEPELVIREIADPARRILTLTVSEGGYGISPRTGRLDVEDPAVRADVELASRGGGSAGSSGADGAGAPRTVVGLLAAGLTARAASGEPFTVLPCDNVQAAGAAARAVVVEFLQSSGASDDVLRYLEQQVAFPNAMVDRIVPATTPETSDRVAALLGVRDEAPVRAEAFSMWVLEDLFPGGRPAWDQAGAIMTDEVEHYEHVKLRILNGTHSLLAYLGGLAGAPTIPASFETPWIQEAALALIERDMLPSITLPTGFDAEEYVRELTGRWHNHALGDRTSRVGSDGSMKLPQRIPDAALHARAEGRAPHLLALMAAAWIAAVAPPAGASGLDQGGVCAEMNEPVRAALAELTAGAASAEEHARRIIEAGYLGEAMQDQEEFIARTGELLGIIVSAGPEAAARDAVAAGA